MHIKYLSAAICTYIFDKWILGQGWGKGARQESKGGPILLSGNSSEVYWGQGYGGGERRVPGMARAVCACLVPIWGSRAISSSRALPFSGLADIKTEGQREGKWGLQESLI